MKTGEIVFNGNAGMHTGEKMVGGKITINGNSGEWTGCGIKKGIIEIHGNAGDYTSFTLQRYRHWHERRLNHC